MPPHKDLTGKKFGKIEVLEFDHINDKHVYFYKCRCECGTIKIIKGSNLTSGGTKSCGCITKEVFNKIFEKHFKHMRILTAQGKIDRFCNS